MAAAVATGIILIPSDKKEPVVEENKNLMTEEVKTPFVEQPDSADTIVLPITPTRVTRAEIPAEVIETIPPVVETKPVLEEPAKEQEETKPEKEKEIEVEPLLTEELPVMLPAKSSNKGFSLGIKADANLFADNISQRGGAMMFSRSERSAVFNELLKEENGEFELEHKQPISFGITISKQIAPRLSLETGLIYTHLSSKIKSNSVFNISETQTFEYLGVPLSLNYSLYEFGKGKIYISAGGMIQKDIKGKYISNMNVSISDLENINIANDIFYTEPYYIKQKIDQSKPQFSVHATLGVSYPLYRRLYIYGAVGGAYYFDAGNQYRTIYSDKKTQLNLNLGVKFDF